MHRIFSVACFSVILFIANIPSYAQTAALTVPEVLTKVRKAAGYKPIKKLKYGFSVEEIRDSADSKDITIKMFGRAGEVRRESRPLDSSTFLFDGRELWLINRVAASARNGSPATVNQKQLEKLVLPWWIQSGWWLNENAPLDLALLPAESSEKQVALSVRFKNGVVGSKLFISRETWLPETMVVEQAKGPVYPRTWRLRPRTRFSLSPPVKGQL